MAVSKMQNVYSGDTRIFIKSLKYVFVEDKFIYYIIVKGV